MKKTALLIIISLLIMSCHQTEIISEISLSPTSEPILPIMGAQDSIALLKSGSTLLIINANGQITRYDTVNNITDHKYQFKTGIKEVLFSQTHLVLLRLTENQELSIFNSKKMVPLNTIKDTNIEIPVGLDDTYLIYKHSNRLIFYNYLKKNSVKYDIKENTVFNSAIDDNAIYVTTRNQVLIYDKKTGKIDPVELKFPASSGSLKIGDTLYYGSTNRELIKFSLTRKKIEWRFKLSARLDLTPQKADKLITITPKDNNIYFFKENGTLYWWGKLDSTRLFPPLVMQENICIFLMGDNLPELKFFDFKKRTMTAFKLNHKVSHLPVHLNKYIYILGKEEKPETKEKNKPLQSQDIQEPAELQIIKLGNRYGVDLELTPKDILAVGKSVIIKMEPINLIKPEYNIEIIDMNEGSVFKKIIDQKEDPWFFWIPEKEGNYNLNIDIKTTNRNDLTVSRNLTVINLENHIKKYYFDILKNCTNDLTIATDSYSND